MNKKFICKCQGLILSEYYAIDISWPDEKFKRIQNNEIEPVLSRNFNEVQIKEKKDDDRRRRF